MATLADLSRKGGLDALAALYEQSPRPMDAMAFASAAKMAPNNAIKLREEMRALGLINAKVVRESGAIKEWEIRLTDIGHEVGRHIAEIRNLLSTLPSVDEDAAAERPGFLSRLRGAGGNREQEGRPDLGAEERAQLAREGVRRLGEMAQRARDVRLKEGEVVEADDGADAKGKKSARRR